MAPTTTQQKPTAIQPRPAATSLADVIKAKQGSFSEVATKYLSPERLVKLALVAINKMPDLQKVPAGEIIAELITCARLGLEPNVEGGRWLLPFKRGERYEVVGVTDYRGLIDIARRSGEVLSIHADVRRAQDEWEFWVESGGPTLVHLKHRRLEDDEQRGDVLGAYAIVRLRNGEVQAEYLPLAKINEAKGRSRGASSDFSPWNRDFEAMAKKTAIRRLYNLLPKTPEIQAAREALAEEDERDRASDMTVEVPPAAARATDRVKAAVAQKLGKPAPAPSDEPAKRLTVEDHVQDETFEVETGGQG